tara:strand:- start:46 stop:516 length:471 start_codon:yes stop_codon:yes gene_type:complete
MQKYKVYINNEAKIITDNWQDFCLDYLLIKAAGGVVYNEKNQLLMIFRNNKWDLPKGKLESNESIKDCALREVEEECGVKNLYIDRELDCSYHVYEINNNKILKQTYWFKMKTKFNGKLIPQIQEGITKVEWVKKEDIDLKLNNSFSTIEDILINE